MNCPAHIAKWLDKPCIDSCPLNRFSLSRDLGVSVNNKMCFHDDILDMVDSTYRTLDLVSGLVCPILEYACVVWSPAGANFTARIEWVQKLFKHIALRRLFLSKYWKFTTLPNSVPASGTRHLGSTAVAGSSSFCWQCTPRCNGDAFASLPPTLLHSLAAARDMIQAILSGIRNFICSADHCDFHLSLSTFRLVCARPPKTFLLFLFFSSLSLFPSLFSL